MTNKIWYEKQISKPNPPKTARTLIVQEII